VILDGLLDLLDSRGVATGFYRELAEFTPYAVQFRYEGLGPGHDPLDREAALSRAGARFSMFGICWAGCLSGANQDTMTTPTASNTRPNTVKFTGQFQSCRVKQ